MVRSLQGRVNDLEYELKALKAQYPVAGSRVDFVVTRSATWTRTGGNNQTIFVRVRFIPSVNNTSGNNLIMLSAEVSTMANFSFRYEKAYYYNEPQTGNGHIVLNLAIATAFASSTYYIRVTASGSSGGSFGIL